MVMETPRENERSIKADWPGQALKSETVGSNKQPFSSHLILDVDQSWQIVFVEEYLRGKWKKCVCLLQWSVGQEWAINNLFYFLCFHNISDDCILSATLAVIVFDVAHLQTS